MNKATNKKTKKNKDLVKPYSFQDTVGEGCLVTGMPDWDRLVATLEENFALKSALRSVKNDQDWRFLYLEAQHEAKLAQLRLKEIVELVGIGGDGTAFGSVESALSEWNQEREVLLRKIEELENS